MTQFGMDRHTGRWNSGWESVAQAIEVLLTTRYFERVLREYVGSPLPALLGETANLETISKFRWAQHLATLLVHMKATAHDRSARRRGQPPGRQGRVEAAGLPCL